MLLEDELGIQGENGQNRPWEVIWGFKLVLQRLIRHREEVKPVSAGKLDHWQHLLDFSQQGFLEKKKEKRKKLSLPFFSPLEMWMVYLGIVDGVMSWDDVWEK